jgi:hypothetical protein
MINFSVSVHPTIFAKNVRNEFKKLCGGATVERNGA